MKCKFSFKRISTDVEFHQSVSGFHMSWICGGLPFGVFLSIRKLGIYTLFLMVEGRKQMFTDM